MNLDNIVKRSNNICIVGKDIQIISEGKRGFRAYVGFDYSTFKDTVEVENVCRDTLEVGDVVYSVEGIPSIYYSRTNSGDLTVMQIKEQLGEETLYSTYLGRLGTINRIKR